MLDPLSTIQCVSYCQVAFFGFYNSKRLWSFFIIVKKPCRLKKNNVSVPAEDFIKTSKMQGRRRHFFLFYLGLITWVETAAFIHRRPLPYVIFPYVTICFIKCMVVFLWMQPYIVSSLIKTVSLLQANF